MPTYSLTVIPVDIPQGGLIPPIHKNASSCVEPNISPAIAWEYSFDLLEEFIETIELHVTDLDAPGTGYGNKFNHWKVTNIAPAIVGIGQNLTWGGPEVIHPSDWPSGDAVSGWNGPCAPTVTGHNYSVRIVAVIKPGVVETVGSQTVEGEYIFKDNSSNLSPSSGTGNCGTSGCLPGFELVGDKCQQISNATYTVSETTYVTQDALGSTAYGAFGMRIYENIDNAVLPLRDVSTNAILHEDNGAGPAVPQYVGVGPLAGYNSPIQPFSNPGIPWNSNDGTGATTTNGRLNIAGIWTGQSSGSGGSYKDLPVGEWIGFSRCVIVPVTKVYCFGFAADNRTRIKINGVLICQITLGSAQSFNYWHVVPLTLNQGVNIIEMEGRNNGGIASFGAEIYDATPDELVVLTGNAGVQALANDYILFTTALNIGQNFDIGQNSGFVCPNGFAYDSCTSGNCASIEYVDPAPLECAQMIQNCKDENDTYLIEMDPGETEILYTNSVYDFAGASEFTGKCFILIGQTIGLPTITGVTVNTAYGDSNCIACSPSEKMESCLNPGTFSYILLKVGDEPMVVNNIYEVDVLEGCYKYTGTVETNGPQFIDVTVTASHGPDNCLACAPCFHYLSCDDATDIYIRLADGQAEPDLNVIYELAGDPAIENRCWQYQGPTEPGCTEDYIDITVVTVYPCTTCDACNVGYLLTDCEDPSNTMVIDWSQGATPLDESLTYVFDFDTNTCWTVEALPPVLCND
jgi:phosphatidylethanolamine-binding protein (PEBP) family uncharacterized protein